MSFETSLPGVFAVGDVRHGSTKRVASAVGDGARAVQNVHQYFEEVERLVTPDGLTVVEGSLRVERPEFVGALTLKGFHRPLSHSTWPICRKQSQNPPPCAPRPKSGVGNPHGYVEAPKLDLAHRSCMGAKSCAAAMRASV
jgi:hypothetical protein